MNMHDSYSNDEDSVLSDVESPDIIDAIMKDAPAISQSILETGQRSSMAVPLSSVNGGKELVAGVEFNDDVAWHDSSFAERKATSHSSDNEKHQGCGFCLLRQCKCLSYKMNMSA
jgi:hypothetical protein